MVAVRGSTTVLIIGALVRGSKVMTNGKLTLRLGQRNPMNVVTAQSNRLHEPSPLVAALPSSSLTTEAVSFLAGSSTSLGASLKFRSILDLSSEEESSSSKSPPWVSYSGGSIQSLGTMHGRATPMLAALFNQPGPFLPVNRWHRCDVK